ncbi:hypothetical protein IAR55_004529 [Kwoniella newhampshirensis]|uniref:Stress-response A/B barrel domain-containing protein n=1 Tax=Kwoniella newhampshirensis TaxID=1651941 RepID=A0AAW0Z0T3_9TREE
MAVYHIVAFKTSSPETIPQLTEGFLNLPSVCLHPSTKKSYIKIAKGGKQVSTEGKDHGMQVCFIMEFESREDLAYYLDEDPVHEQFKQKAGKEYGVLDVVAMDFVEGAY